jgi:hypothetical protein
VAVCVASMVCRAAFTADTAWRHRGEEAISIYGGMNHGIS